jgi:hypothetical protein
MSSRASLLRVPLTISLALFGAASSGCVGYVDAPARGTPDGAVTPPGVADSDTLYKVAITSLPGASPGAGIVGAYKPADLVFGSGPPPALSNTVLSALPGAPPKPLFVGQDQPFDKVLVAIDGKPGYFAVAAGQQPLVALDLVTQPSAANGSVTLKIATKTGDVISAAATVTLVIDPHVFVTAGDLENHDSGESSVADLFGTVLEAKQGSPAAPVQVLDNHNNNNDVVGGVKGPIGPFPTGHREVVWDGVPETLRNKANFNQSFFDRQTGGAAGVQGGVIFKEIGGTGQEVNDALNGAVPDPANVGPPVNPPSELGGDFSNHNASYAGNLLSFTQSASFAPLGTVVTDVTFHVAGSQAPGVVNGLGVVFASVDKPQVTSVEYFDENDVSIAKVYSPVQSVGPFPVAGPLAANKFPFTFVGYVDQGARIARVRIVSGDTPVDTAANDMPLGNKDVVVFDDIYYGEPHP